MLTQKQQVLLQFIHQRIQMDGVSPSFEEMKEALNLKSKSGIHSLVSALEERGFIRRLPNRARALEVLISPERWQKNTDETGEHDKVVSPVFDQKSIRKTAANTNIGENITLFPGSRSDLHENQSALELPVMGKIAAGVPISAIQDNSNSISVPAGMLGNGEHYALTIEGDSMIQAGIHDGDTVIVCQADTARGGDIVVALIDDEEATLKRFRKQGSQIALEAANPAYETRCYNPNRIKVQGRLVGLIRQYH